MSIRTFAAEAFSNLNTTAAILPSSRYLARSMLAPLPLDTARVVVEFGPGTGAMTRPLLGAMRPDAKLLCFEINPRFAHYLRDHIEDPRFVLINDCAETLGSVLAEQGESQVDAVVSSLGLTLMPNSVREGIFDNLVGLLASHAVLTQFQYLHGLLLHEIESERLSRYSTARFLRRYFPAVRQRLVWRNIPPAVVFTCDQ